MKTITLFLILVVSGGCMASIESKKAQMLYTTVKIERFNGGGSGIVIGTKGRITFILTAQHCVGGRGPIRVTLYPSRKQYFATVLQQNKKLDVALIAIAEVHKYVARLSPPKDYSVYQEVWKTGAGMELDPHPSTGIISGVVEHFYLVNAPIIFGDSGGGIFVQSGQRYFLIGIISAVGMLTPTVPIYHMGYASNIYSIWSLF